MRRILLVLTLLAVGAPLLLSGCGEDDSTADAGGSTAEAPAAITKAKFVKQANAICAKTNQELAGISEKFSKEKNLSEKNRPTDAQVNELATLSLPPIKKQVDELRALGVPAGDEEKVDGILSAAEGAISKGEREPAAIYGANGGAFAEANRLATDYGLEQCGE